MFHDIGGGRPCAYIHKVQVEEGSRRRGVGSGLVGEAVDWAKRHGCYKVFLVCHEDVVGFYEKCGFHRDQVGMVKML